MNPGPDGGTTDLLPIPLKTPAACCTPQTPLAGQSSDLRRCRDPQDFFDFQQDLLAAVDAVREPAAGCRWVLKRVTRGQGVPAGGAGRAPSSAQRQRQRLPEEAIRSGCPLSGQLPGRMVALDLPYLTHLDVIRSAQGLGQCPGQTGAVGGKPQRGRARVRDHPVTIRGDGQRLGPSGRAVRGTFLYPSRMDELQARETPRYSSVPTPSVRHGGPRVPCARGRRIPLPSGGQACSRPPTSLLATSGRAFLDGRPYPLAGWAGG